MTTRSFIAVLTLAVGAHGAAASAQPSATDHRYEVTLVVGASLLGADGHSSEPLSLDSLDAFEAFLPAGTLRRLLPSAIQAEDHLGGSALLGFQVSRRVARRGWLEGAFLVAPTHTRRRSASFRCPAEVCALAPFSGLGDALAAEERVVAYHYGLGFAYELSRGEVRPFLSAGAGAITYDLAGGASTSFAFDVGAGARLAFGERVGARLEVVDRIVPDHYLSGDTEHDVHVRAGVVFRLP